MQQYQEIEKIKNMVDLGGSVGGVAQILFFAVMIFFIAALVLLCFCGITLIFIKAGKYLFVHIDAAIAESSQSILAKKITLPLNAGTGKKENNTAQPASFARRG